MVTYSHSRVSCFENCPYNYKLKYIDKKRPEFRDTIETFLGTIVHQVLADLHKDLKFKKTISKLGSIKSYRELWDKGYSENIKIVKQGLVAINYKKMGEQFLSDYYDKYEPFDQLTILGLETKDKLTLLDGNKWSVRIDKLACDDKGNYYVIDYKTNSRMKDQEEADSDRQLAMYSIWVKNQFKDAKSVKLVWHMLAFNKESVSERTDEQLEKLQQDVCDKIKEIESATEFPTKTTSLCNYCGFQYICPSFKHKLELELIEKVKEFKDDDGVKLVESFGKIKSQLSELKKKKEEVESELIEFAKQREIDVVYGDNMEARINEFDKIVLPDGEDKELFIRLLKDKGVYEECSMICYPRLNSLVVKGEIDEAIIDGVEIVKGVRISLSKRKDIK